MTNNTDSINPVRSQTNPPQAHALPDRVILTARNAGQVASRTLQVYASVVKWGNDVYRISTQLPADCKETWEKCVGVYQQVLGKIDTIHDAKLHQGIPEFTLIHAQDENIKAHVFGAKLNDWVEIADTQAFSNNLIEYDREARLPQLQPSNLTLTEHH